MKVKLVLKRTGQGCTLEIDGRDMSGSCVGVEVRAHVEDVTTVVCYFRPDEVEIEGEVDAVPWVEENG